MSFLFCPPKPFVYYKLLAKADKSAEVILLLSVEYEGGYTDEYDEIIRENFIRVYESE